VTILKGKLSNSGALASEQRVTPAYGMEAVRAQIVRCLLERDKRSVVLTGAAGTGSV
jgi:ATP-dependent Clp protease ATP-binding subunit ClpA